MKHQNILTRENHLIDIPANLLKELKNNFTGNILFEGDENYDEARSVWNGMIDRKPALVAQCKNTADIQLAVNFAKTHKLLLSVKGGGHHVAGGAVCDRGVMVDLSEMKEVTLDQKNKKVIAEAGATWKDIDTATQQKGMAVPGGIVSDTGIAGLTLGGGIGWLRRKHGLSCDNLVSAEIITANGNLLTVNEYSHSDLFWTIKGGGSGFGIVSSFEYKTHKIGPEVMTCMVFYPISEAEKVMKYYQSRSENLPPEVSLLLILGTIPPGHSYPPKWHGENFIQVAAVYSGDLTEGEKVLQPFREISKPIVDKSCPMKYTDIQTYFDDNYPKNELRYYWKSLFFDNLSDDTIAKIIELGKSRPSSLSTVDVWLLGGAIDNVSPLSSAFPHRGAKHLLSVESNWRDEHSDKNNIQWTKSAISAFTPLSGGKSYINFEDTGDESLKTALGEHYKKLQIIKEKYDPEGVFNGMKK
jgi:hypothetical protein